MGLKVEIGNIGPPGPTGPTGPSEGPTGPTGSQGPQGSQGWDGAQGSQGAIGPQGYQGATGSQGSQGVQGATGPTSVQYGEFSSRPSASGNTNVLYMPTDGYYPTISNGSSWGSYAISGFKSSNPPSAASLSAVNVDSYTTLESDGDGLLLTQMGRGNSGEYNSLFVTSVPSAPYKLVVGFEWQYFQSVNWNEIGLCLTNGNSGSPSFVAFALGYGSSGFPSVTCGKFTNPTSVSSIYDEALYNTIPYRNSFIFFRFRDNNTDRYFEISSDCRNWITHYSTTRTDFITPTHCGIVIKQSVSSVSTSTLRTKAKVFHWYLGT
jgi:hypothetical protein